MLNHFIGSQNTSFRANFQKQSYQIVLSALELTHFSEAPRCPSTLWARKPYTRLKSGQTRCVQRCNHEVSFSYPEGPRLGCGQLPPREARLKPQADQQQVEVLLNLQDKDPNPMFSLSSSHPRQARGTN